MARPSIRRSGNAWHSDDPLGSNHGSHSTCKLNSIQQPWVWTYLACPHLWPFWTGKYGNDVLIQWNWRQLLYSIPHQNVRCKDVRAVFFFNRLKHQNLENHQALDGFPTSPWISGTSRVFNRPWSPSETKLSRSGMHPRETNIHCCLRRHINWTAQTHHLSSSPESYPWTLG